MQKYIKIILSVIVAALSVLILASGIYNFGYSINERNRQEKNEQAYRISRSVEAADSLDAYIEPRPNVLFLPSPKQAEQIKTGMTLQQVISLLGKPQQREGSGLIGLRWKLLVGRELYVTFLPQENAENRGESLAVFDFTVK